jgi:PAS domain S-box-containing protein
MPDNNATIKRPLVLVADDDATVRILARESLEQAGFEVEEIEKGTEVLSAFERFRPDAVLLDVILPELDGFSVCAALRKMPGGDFLPVLMLTGMDDIDSIYRAYEVGATDFVIKPINWTILGNRVQYMLRASQVTRDLVKSEGKNRALLNAIPDLMFQMSKDGTFLDFKAAKNIDLAVSPSELSNRTLDGVLPRDIARQTMQHMERAFKTDEVQVFEYKLMEEGNPRYYETRLVVSGEQQVLAIVRDISERKRAEEALRKSQEQLIQAHKMKALGTLVAGVAHEINNPINLVKLNIPLFQKMWRDIEPVLKEQETGEPGKKYGGMTYDFLKDNVSQMFSDMDIAARRVIKTVADLKNFARQDKEIEKAPVQITTAVESAVRMAHATLKKSGVALKQDLDGSLPLVEGNLRSIEQIVLNLIINAFQSIEGEAGTVTVATGYNAEERTVFLSVADTGKGIAPSMSEKIFDPFFTDRQADGGTGLGLSITYNLVKAHGGEISFQSDKEKGTTFTVVLPTVQKKDVIKILVADDNRLIREILIDALGKHRDCRVEEAAHGAEACIKLGTFLPDLLILNMFMPEMDGIEICKVIKAEPKLSELKVIIITSSPDNADVKKAAEMGFTNIIPKPLDIEQFVRVADTLLRESSG